MLMANLQVKNVPESLHQRLRRYAKAHHTTLSRIVLRAIERDLQHDEFYRQLEQRAPIDLGVSAAGLLEQERRQRDSDVNP
jgi:plasmid stability protein